MRLLPFSWYDFIGKFLGCQGGVILTMLREQNTNPWDWAQTAFMGLILAWGIDTSTWIYSSVKENKRQQNALKSKKHR